MDLMHVLLLDYDYSNALTRALQLSGYGMVVETAQDFDAASRRLSTMQFDVVLVNVEPADDCGRRAVEHLQKEFRILFSILTRELTISSRVLAFTSEGEGGGRPAYARQLASKSLLFYHPREEGLSMHTAPKRWLGVLFVLVFGAPLYAQSISDPTGDVTPAWADYTNIVYEQQGESLYVTITFAVPVSEKGYKHSGNTFFNDYDDDISTGQPGNVGSECNLTFAIGTVTTFGACSSMGSGISQWARSLAGPRLLCR